MQLKEAAQYHAEPMDFGGADGVFVSACWSGDQARSGEETFDDALELKEIAFVGLHVIESGRGMRDFVGQVRTSGMNFPADFEEAEVAVMADVAEDVF